MAPTIKITDFNRKGKAKEHIRGSYEVANLDLHNLGNTEISRMILAQAGVEYEDKRITKEEWPALKKSMT